MIFGALEYPFTAQLADLHGQTAAVDLEEVCQLLAVKGDVKAVASHALGFHGKIGQQLLPRRSLGGDFDALVEQDGLGCQILHQIEDQLLMKAAVVGTGVQNVRAVDQHDLARLVCDHAHGQCRYLRAGERLGKDLRRPHFAEDTAVAVIVHLQDLCRARQHDADVLCHRPLGEYGVFLVKLRHLCTKTRQHAEQILVLDLRKQGTFP